MKWNRPWIALAAMLALTPAFAATPARQAYIKASNAGYLDQFGSAIAISGDTLVVGAVFESSSAIGVNGDQQDNATFYSGAAYVFVRQGTNWTQQAYLKASNTGAGDLFGSAVAISGDTVVIGSPGEDSNATGVNGNQSDNTVPSAGAAYVFVRAGTNWTQQAYLKSSNNGTNFYEGSIASGDGFGHAVAVFGDTIVVGAYRERSNATGVNGNQADDSIVGAGAAYVFVRDGSNWTQQAYLKSATNRSDAHFGSSVAALNDMVAVGAESALGGAVYIFSRSGTNWITQTRLKAAFPNNGDFFGRSIALSGDTVLVSAPGEDSQATGVNGDQSDNSLQDAGAAYVFVRNGTNWSQQAYLKASTAIEGGGFGRSVALDGNTAVINGTTIFAREGTNWLPHTSIGISRDVSVAISSNTLAIGVPGDNSSATGVNGDENDTGAMFSGAAYVFIGIVRSPQLSLTTDNTGGYFVRFFSASNITYRVERAPNVAGPWTTNATLTALTNGPIEFHETNAPPGQAFYRVVQQ